MMDIKPNKTPEDYDEALIKVATLMDAKPNTPEGDQLEILTMLIEAYEDKVFPRLKHVP